MEKISVPEIVEALATAGVSRGDVVNVHSRLYSIGAVREAQARPQRLADCYLEALRSVLGEEGTIVVPSFTLSFARYGAPFVLESSPSEMGVLSECVRRRPGSSRSLHPVQSLCALGWKAEELTIDHPPWNVGHDTVWDRMLRAHAKFVSIGVPPSRSASMIHQIEHLACVPYQYHKVLQGEVYAGGRKVDREFILAARYLEFGVRYDVSRLESDLADEGVMTRTPLGGGFVWVVPMNELFETGIRRLKQDPYYFLAGSPSFTAGRIPLDGITNHREQRVSRYFLA